MTHSNGNKERRSRKVAAQDVYKRQERRERLELEGREQMPPDSYYAEDEEMERELSELGVDDQTPVSYTHLYEVQTSEYPAR